MTTVTQSLTASQLTDHPLLAHIPVLAPDSLEFASLRESLRADGQLYEILIDSGNRVVDGRNRRNALRAINQPVRCRVVADGDIGTIIFRTLMQRRHFGKGARAFLAVPLVGPLIDAAKERQRNSLKKGVFPVTDSIGHGPSLLQIALDVGVSLDVLDQARRLHELLAKATPEVATDVTDRVLSGELGLGYACTSLLNHEHNTARAAKLGKRQRHEVYFEQYLPRLDHHWRQASEAQQIAIREKLRGSLAHWPEDLLEETQSAARAALKRLREGEQ